MPVFDFPASPSDGQQFTPIGGPFYQYSAATGAWMIVGSAGLAFTGVAPPPNPLPNQLWFESDTGNLFIWYDDGNSKQWVQVAGQQRTTPGLWPTAEARNRLVNPAMQHSQENAKGTTYTASGTYVADQWAEVHSLAAGTPAFACIATTAGFPSWIRLNSTVANPSPGAGDYYMLLQYVEGIRVEDFGWGTAAAKPVVLRFDARSSIAGTFGLSVRNTTPDRSYVRNITVPGDNTWHTYTVAIPGDTTGTWAIDTTRALGVYFCATTGSINIGVEGWQAGSKIASPGVSNWMSVAGQTFDVTNVGLHLDPQNTGLAPPWQEPDYASELIACRRYWQLLYSLFSGSVTTGIVYYGLGPIPVQMRGTPTLTGANSANSGFPATVGGGNIGGSNTMYENRTSNATATNGLFSTVWTANARL